MKLDDPANTQAVIDYLLDPSADAWRATPSSRMEEFTSLLNVNNIPALAGFIAVIMGIGVVIGFAVVCLSMYMAVLQRTREIGILKSLGASKGFILGIILSEALLLGTGRDDPGNPHELRSVLAHPRPQARVAAHGHRLRVVADRGWHHACSALCWARFIPGLTAAAHDPIEALAYE